MKSMSNHVPFRFAQLCRTPIEDMNAMGTVKILVNSLILIAKEIDGIRTELQAAEVDAHIINAMISIVIPAMQNWLDQVAGFCQRQDAVEGCDGDIYFHSYMFKTAAYDTIGHLQRKLAEIRFDGMSFNQICNLIKHESPWIGRVTESERNMRRDIHVRDDSFIAGVIYPAFRACKSIATFLARVHGLTGFKIPIV